MSCAFLLRTMASASQAITCRASSSASTASTRLAPVRPAARALDFRSSNMSPSKCTAAFMSRARLAGARNLLWSSRWALPAIRFPVILRSMALLLNERQVRTLLPMPDLIDAMERALTAYSSGAVEQPVRTVVDVGRDKNFFGVMPASVTGDQLALGAKLVT